MAFGYLFSSIQTGGLTVLTAPAADIRTDGLPEAESRVFGNAIGDRPDSRRFSRGFRRGNIQ